MDVGQIPGMMSEPPRREKNAGQSEGDGFASFLKQPPAPQDRMVKSDGTETAGDSPSMKKGVDKDAGTSEKATPADASAQDQSKSVEIAPQKDTKGSETTDAAAKAGEQISPDTDTHAVTAAVQNMIADLPEVALNKPDVTAITTATPQNSTPANTTETPQNSITTNATAAPQNSTTTNAELKIPPLTGGEAKVAESTAAQATAAATGDKTASKPSATTSDTTENIANQLPLKTLETLRADATSKMSEKDILSTKIAEMLRDGKGSIAANAGKKQSFQSTLASSTTLVTATMAATPVATANGMTTPAFTPAAMDGLMLQPANPANTPAQGMKSDTTGQVILPVAPTGAIQHVDATAANTASQAANAARVAHVPVAEQLSTHISNAIKEGHDRIKISLHPSELGRVEVKLDIGHDGRILAAVSVDRQETLDLLQRDTRSLERALQDAGFETGSNSLNFSLRQDGGDGHEQDAGFAGLDLSPETLPADEALPDMPMSAFTGSARNDGSLDIKV